MNVQEENGSLEELKKVDHHKLLQYCRILVHVPSTTEVFPSLHSRLN